MEYIVKPEEEGRKLLSVLRGSMSVSWSSVKKARWHGTIMVNGEEAHTDRIVRAGDRVSIAWEPALPVYRPEPCELPIRIAWEDEHYLAVDKPAGIASQSSRNHPDDSLENALFAREGCPEHFIYRPVNRLDKGTGGLMLVARSAHAQHLAQQALHTPEFRRRYLAWTDGIPDRQAGRLDFPILRGEGATVRRVVSPEGKPAATRYRVLEKRGSGALVLLELETGRTHQIRVHLSHIGCPVRGDFLYGTERPEEFPGCFALHSAALCLKHPLTGETLRLTSLPPWAQDMNPDVLFMDMH